MGDVSFGGQFSKITKWVEELKIQPIQPIIFTKYRNVLKKEWLKGNMPSVKHDIGGNRLTVENVTNGHMLAKSKGGLTNLSNITLETMEYNQLKGNKPFLWFFDTKAFMQYCDEVTQVKLKNFDGLEYVRGIIETAFKLLREGK